MQRIVKEGRLLPDDMIIKVRSLYVINCNAPDLRQCCLIHFFTHGHLKDKKHMMHCFLIKNPRHMLQS